MKIRLCFETPDIFDTALDEICDNGLDVNWDTRQVKM